MKILSFVFSLLILGQVAVAADDITGNRKFTLTVVGDVQFPSPTENVGSTATIYYQGGQPVSRELLDVSKSRCAFVIEYDNATFFEMIKHKGAYAVLVLKPSVLDLSVTSYDMTAQGSSEEPMSVKFASLSFTIKRVHGSDNWGTVLERADHKPSQNKVSNMKCEGQYISSVADIQSVIGTNMLISSTPQPQPESK